jgi:hypothetical protein
MEFVFQKIGFKQNCLPQQDLPSQRSFYLKEQNEVLYNAIYMLKMITDIRIVTILSLY